MTPESVRDAERSLVTTQVVWVFGIVVFWIFALGLPALAVALTVRRSRALVSVV